MHLIIKFDFTLVFIEQNILTNASPLDTLLNSLALEFVFQLDESISGNIWFDSSKRYIMAGAIELIIQEALDTESLMDLQLFSAKYNVPEKTLLEACSGDHNIFWNKSQAKIDVEDVRFMSKGERIDHGMLFIFVFTLYEAMMVLQTFVSLTNNFIYTIERNCADSS